MSRYPVPQRTVRAEHEVSRSRFIATLGYAESVEVARAFIAARREEMPDAHHHVYAFKVGYKASLIEGVSDDGEPAGTSGPPVLAVLRGAPVGDVIIVVSRYFGGTKLGTGGLVRAYGDSARAVLALMTTREKIEMRRLGLTLPYALYERFKQVASHHQAIIEGEEFEAEITLYISLPVDAVEAFSVAMRDLTAGRVTPIALD